MEEKQHPEPELRSESRVKVPNEPVLVSILPPDSPLQTFARVVDISRSGVGLLLQQPIDEGTRVKIRIDDTAIFGSVRYCNGCPDGTFRAGVASDTVVADSAVRD